ncbi:MAG: SMP-30/gluconolactonase/LRE family protein [Actinomycetota bacterium]
MRKAPVVAVLALASLLIPTSAANAKRVPVVGPVETLSTYDADAGELPEGIAIDKRGRIYVTMPFIGELRRIERDGTESVFAHLPTGGGFGALGLAVDAPGNIYACVVTFDPATHGVYRITPAGDVARLPGSEAIGFPNGLAFGDGGTIYVADSTGAVWRIPKGGSAELWSDSSLLEGNDSAPLPFPIGANGVAYRHGTVYVTNTELASVVSIPVEADGSAGEAELLIQDPALGGADGVALDAHGELYVAVIAQSTIVRIAGDGSDLTVIADGDDGLDFDSSLAFGTGGHNRTTLYGVNFSVGPFFGEERTHGPALFSLDVGVPGQPLP